MLKSIFAMFRIGVVSFYLGFKTRGVIQTFQMFFEALNDELYNLQSGLDLSSFFDPKDSSFEIKHRDGANFYQPVRVRPFKKLMKLLDLSPDGRFVDIGSGKGKALFLAEEFGFKQLIGVELVPELCAVSDDNIKKFESSNPKSTAKFETLQMSGADYELLPEDRILFLNDPFDNKIMQLFVKQVLCGLPKHSGELVFIYKNNNKRPMPSLEALKEKGKYSTYNFRGNFFEIIKFKRV